MTHLDAITQALPGRQLQEIVTGPAATWVRADDFVVGSVFVSADHLSDEIDAAYQLLDGEGVNRPVTKQEIWNLVLLVRVPENREDLARSIAQDLRYSRKVPYLDGEPVPRLVGPFLSSKGRAAPLVDNPIVDALTSVGTAEERPLLLSVLLGGDRRDREKADQLLDLLEKAGDHAG